MNDSSRKGRWKAEPEERWTRVGTNYLKSLSCPEGMSNRLNKLQQLRRISVRSSA